MRRVRITSNEEALRALGMGRLEGSRVQLHVSGRSLPGRRLLFSAVLKDGFTPGGRVLLGMERSLILSHCPAMSRHCPERFQPRGNGTPSQGRCLLGSLLGWRECFGGVFSGFPTPCRAQGQATFSVSVGSSMTLNSPSGLQRFLSNPSPSPSWLLRGQGAGADPKAGHMSESIIPHQGH